MVIAHVLFDADGVLQTIPGGWQAAMEPYVGVRAREFLLETWGEERPTLAGKGDYLPMLAATLRKYGVPDPVHDVFRDVWHRIDVVDSTISTVRSLRAAGYGVHLATNQEQHRGAYMKSALGFESVFDNCFYSYELGASKPDPNFFGEVVRRIGTEPSSVFFVDDTDANVAGARAAGLRAECWHFDMGSAALLAHLSRHGIVLPGSVPGMNGTE